MNTRCNAAIIRAWRTLPTITALSFVATPGADSRTGWAGQGHARVTCDRDGDDLCFDERGAFTPKDGDRAIAFRNAYRWRLRDGALSLSHERFDRACPVPLVELVAGGDGQLLSRADHVCGDDRYAARLELSTAGFVLCWQIRGPAKDETLVYRYRAG